MLEFCICGPLPHAPPQPLQVAPSETSTSVLLPLASIFFFQCLLCASGLFKLIQTLPWRFACLFVCLVCLHSVLHQLWAFSRVTKRREKKRGKKMPPKQKPLFHCANNMLCSLHRIHPIFADLLILRWDKMTPWLHKQMCFSFHTRLYVTPGFTFL